MSLKWKRDPQQSPKFDPPSVVRFPFPTFAHTCRIISMATRRVPPDSTSTRLVCATMNTWDRRLAATTFFIGTDFGESRATEPVVRLVVVL
jgi:hypothetical protein